MVGSLPAKNRLSNQDAGSHGRRMPSHFIAFEFAAVAEAQSIANGGLPGT